MLEEVIAVSDKPKISAFCEAGCKWETVHRSEYETLVSVLGLEALTAAEVTEQNAEVTE